VVSPNFCRERSQYLKIFNKQKSRVQMEKTLEKKKFKVTWRKPRLQAKKKDSQR
jgi:hypothetical protein